MYSYEDFRILNMLHQVMCCLAYQSNKVSNIVK